MPCLPCHVMFAPESSELCRTTTCPMPDSARSRGIYRVALASFEGAGLRISTSSYQEQDILRSFTVAACQMKWSAWGSPKLEPWKLSRCPQHSHVSHCDPDGLVTGLWKLSVKTHAAASGRKVDPRSGEIVKGDITMSSGLAPSWERPSGRLTGRFRLGQGLARRHRQLGAGSRDTRRFASLRPAFAIFAPLKARPHAPGVASRSRSGQRARALRALSPPAPAGSFDLRTGRG